jgi:hypothetical protein
MMLAAQAISEAVIRGVRLVTTVFIIIADYKTSKYFAPEG